MTCDEDEDEEEEEGEEEGEHPDVFTVSSHLSFVIAYIPLIYLYPSLSTLATDLQRYSVSGKQIYYDVHYGFSHSKAHLRRRCSGGAKQYLDMM